MYYSTIGALALILHLVTNREMFGEIHALLHKRDHEQQADVRYIYFLIAVICYYLADIAWGLLYEHHDNPGLFPYIYSDSVLYFIFMFMTMLTWIRYIVAYLDKRGRRSKALLYATWAMFMLALIYLMINRFYPFIFSFNANHEYIPESGRYIAFILQIALYMITSSYMFYNAHKAYGHEKLRYIAVGLTCLVMELFLIFQIMDSRYPFYAMGLMIGTCVIHSYVEEGEKKEKTIYDHIANGLAEDYEAMYYINIETGEYLEFSTSEKYKSLKVPTTGKDFYAETQVNALKYAHPDDREFAQSLYHKETILANLEGKKSYSYKYRIMIGDEPRYFRFTIMRANDNKHFVLYEKDIDDEITAENIRLENQKKHITFSRIAEGLASNYDVIYYVDTINSNYVSYGSDNTYGQLEARKTGDDFYEDSLKDIPLVVHKNDRNLVIDFLDKDRLHSALESRKRCSIDYRLVINGRSRYFRMTVRKTSDGSHFIVGIENIDAEVRKEKQHLKALNTEKELARRDEMTGVKNKTAYMELEKSVQANIDNDVDYLPFAIVVCDANDLKKINDTEGHVAGDKYIKEASQLLCDIFDHSPVFRIGGDEFVVFLRGNDYTSRNELMDRLHEQIIKNLKSGSGPILASGVAEYEPATDNLVSEVFDRADQKMYEDKQILKSID